MSTANDPPRRVRVINARAKRICKARALPANPVNTSCFQSSPRKSKLEEGLITWAETCSFPSLTRVAKPRSLLARFDAQRQSL